MSSTTSDSPDSYNVLITGANTGLGFSTCCRLIDEFLHTRPQSHRLCLIISTRSIQKGEDTITRLEQHLRKACAHQEKKVPGISMLLQRRVEFRREIVDLSSLTSVRKLSRKLLTEAEQGDGPRRLDALICNAGIGGFSGINYFQATWDIITNWIEAVTYPRYKLADIGLKTRPQLAPKESLGQKNDDKDNGASSNPQQQTSHPAKEPPLGEVFCANVFGHYLLAHYLMPLLSAPSPASPSPHGGRIIWLSSLEAYRHCLSLNDIQGLRATEAYESSKRLTDLLVLTADTPSAARAVTRFTSSSRTFPLPLSDSLPPPPDRRPRHYLSHPGVCSTSIMPLPGFLIGLVMLATYIARWLGSPWHTISTYLGATAPVWLALADQEMLDAMEKEDGKGKWGSATDRRGNESAERTEVEGWGFGGKEGEATRKRRGRKKGAKDTTKEEREEFEIAGARCWEYMEDLREEWEERLKGDL